MHASPVIAACQNLFLVEPFLGRGIIPTLRLEDIKIAFAKRLHLTVKKNPGLIQTIRTEQFLDSYNILADHIREFNLDVILALESYSDISSVGSTYLFPRTVQKSVSASNRHSAVFAKKKLYYSGTLPPRKIRLSTFLYYKGLISNYHVMESIAWQKDRRPLLGQMAMQIGKLTADEFARIIVHVKNGECFGTVARKYKFLSVEVIATLVKAQEKYDCRIGRYFIEKKLFCEDEISEVNIEMHKHNLKFSR